MDNDALVEEFRSRQRTTNAESTAYDYGQTAKEWLEWLDAPGSKPYDKDTRDRPSKKAWEATTADLRIFLRQLLEHANLSGLTVVNRRWTLSTFYKELENMAEEGFPIPGDFENPSTDLDVSNWNALKNGTKKSQALKEDVYYLTPAEVEKLAENAPNPKLRNELIIRMLYQTGLRRGELASIKLSDVDTKEQSIDIHAEKTHTNRTVYYRPSLNVLLTRWKNVERNALATADSEYLFSTYKTDQLTGRQVARTIRKAADAADMQEHVFTNAQGHKHMKVTAHVLRHSFAVQCIKNGMDTRTLQKLLGHAKIETTEKYLRVAKSDVRDAARKYGPESESGDD